MGCQNADLARTVSGGRNPYFFAVDSAGNQLPYVDKLTHRLFSQTDVLSLWVTNGEIDFQGRHMTLSNFTLYKENEAKGDYKVVVGTGRSPGVPAEPDHQKQAIA